MKKLLLHAWSLEKVGMEYYLPYTQMVYLQEMVKYFDNITLLAPVNKNPKSETIALPLSSYFILAKQNYRITKMFLQARSL